MGEKKNNRLPSSWFSDKHVYGTLVIVSVLSRIPFLETFNVVTYDGTYYLNQAKTIFGGNMAGAFPIGYPLVVRIFHTILRDYQLAGMAVSFAASVASTILLFRLAARYVSREYAFLAAIVLALNPLFIRFSLMTMSESIYIFWVLLGMLLYAEGKWLWFGAAMGVAVITRPEALAIAGVLGLSQIRHHRRLGLLVASFALVYAVNVAMLSVNAGRVIIVSKTSLFGSGAESWWLRESMIDFEGREKVLETINETDERQDMWRHYTRKMPTELGMVLRHAGPILFALSLYALKRRRYWFLGAALVPFLINPLFTPRLESRFILPYLPVLFLLAGVAIADIRRQPLHRLTVALVVATIAVLPAINRAALLEPEEPNLDVVKTAGIAFRDKINPADKIAGRKPHFAFYAGGEYTPIPLAPYEDVMRYLTRENVQLLELHQPTIHQFRPPLRPLLYSASVIKGELRFRQTYFDPTGVSVYECGLDGDPLRWTRVTATENMDVMPAWSPDGTRIAYRSQNNDVTGGIYVIESSGGGFRKIAKSKMREDEISWSPDGKWIAFADGEWGGLNMYTVNVETGEVSEIVAGGGNNYSPSWSPTGDEIIFCSDRTGRPDIWTVLIATGELHRISHDGGNTRPSISPSTNSVAWIKEGQGVVIMDSVEQRLIKIPIPRRANFAPTWSPDSRYIAVTGGDWGSMDIYLLKADGSNALLLTKNRKRDVMPAWSPDGRSIALASDQDATTASIWVIEGLGPYLSRLESGYEYRVFTPPTP